MKKQKKSAPLLIIGLTGGIGMGKSTVAHILRKMGFPIYSADKAVHNVLKQGGAAVPKLARLFPAAVRRGGIDRKKLGKEVFAQPEKLRQLEKIVHPLIRKQEREFLQQARKAKARAAILEIPLLFETGADKRCDVTFCVTAPRAAQKARVMARPGMNEEKFRAILARQMPNAERCAQADYVIPTGAGIPATRAHLRKIIGQLML